VKSSETSTFAVAPAELGEALSAVRLCWPQAQHEMQLSLARLARELSWPTVRAEAHALDAAGAKVRLWRCNAGAGLSELEEAWLVRSLYREEELTQPQIGILLGRHSLIQEENMNRRVKLALPLAGVFALAGVQCATTQREASDSANPATRQAAAAQQRSEEALKRAQEAQQIASEQTRKAEAAQGQVRLDQERLARDQRIARQEQAKAEQLQTQARQESDRAARETRQQQRQAGGALARQTRQSARGQQMAAGLITEVRPDEVVVQPPTGDAMRFRIGEQTQVRPTERSRRPQALEAVDDLQLALLRREHGDGGELPHRRKRLLHAHQRPGLAQPQRSEPLAERLDPHQALRGLALLHGEGLKQTVGGKARLVRDRPSQKTTAFPSLPRR